MNPNAPNPDLRYAHSEESVGVAWVDERGQRRRRQGRCIDVSARRIHIEVPQRVPLETHVALSTGRKAIPGPSAVKHLTHCDTKFILVLE
jgi:hypothetical protein